jgi:hypothetical protein
MWKYVAIAIVLMALAPFAAAILGPLFVPAIVGLVLLWAVLYLCFLILRWIVRLFR